MSVVISFVTVMAWLVGIFSLLGIFVCSVGILCYEGSNRQLLDGLQGKGVDFYAPIGKHLFRLAVCGAWIICAW